MIKSMSRLIVIVLLIQTFPLFAADWQEFFANSSFTVVSSSENEYQLNISIANNDVGVEMRIDNPDYAPYLLQMTAVEEQLRNLKKIVPQKIEIVLQNNHSVIYIIPKMLPVRNGNAASYLPAGIRLYYEQKLEYDFRMLVNTLVLNIKGQYFNETHLLSRINEALEDPLAYIASQEPSFLLKKINVLEDKFNKLQEETIPDLTASDRKAAADIDAIYAMLEQVQSDINQIIADINQIIADINMFKNASIRSDIRMNISDAAITAIVEAYNPQSSLSTSKEIRAKLQEQGHKVNTKAVRAVIAIYFGQYIK